MTTTQKRNGDMVDLLSTDFVRVDDPSYSFGTLDSMYKSLPALRAYWPCSATGSAGELVDTAGGGYHLTNVSDSLFGEDEYGANVEYDGSADYHTHADAAGFDILGTEAYIDPAVRGLTLGAWVKPVSASGNEWVMSKHDAASSIGSSYYIAKLGNDWGFAVSSGSNSEGVTTPGGLAIAGAWHFVVGRFTPSTSIDVIINGATTTGVSAFSSINNSAVSFNISGRNNGSNLFDGKVSRAFLCAGAVPDKYLYPIYHYGRVLYGL